MKVFYLYAVDMAGTIVGQIRNQRINPALNLVQEGPGGHVDQRYVAISQGQPALQHTTTAIKAALDTCGWNGTPVEGLNEMNFWFRQGEEGGTRKTGSDHVRATVNKGILYPTTLRAPHLPPATIDYSVMASWDGSNYPITLTKNVALAVEPATDQLYCAGPVYVNGAEVEGVQEINVAFGFQIEIQSHKGLPWPVYVGIRARQPVITIRLLDMEAYSDITLGGQAVDGTPSFDFYLRKVAEGGLRVPDATAEHISGMVEKGIITTADSGAAMPNPSDATLTITPVYDGTNDSITWDTATALP